MQSYVRGLRFTLFRLSYLSCSIALLSALSSAPAQTTDHESYYAPKNAFGVLGAYSPGSSHMLLGDAENRMLLNIGFIYNHRLFTNSRVNVQYSGELVPVALESDPLGLYTQKQTTPIAETVFGYSSPVVTCTPSTTPYSYINPENGIIYSGTLSISCSGRRWVMGQAMSPIGLQENFLPGRRTQPFLVSHGGYRYSSQEIPISGAGSFNFMFDVGAGVEFHNSKNRSIRVEYRYHHISNHNTATLNPGIDNGLIQFSYCLGWGR